MLGSWISRRVLLVIWKPSWGYCLSFRVVEVFLSWICLGGFGPTCLLVGRLYFSLRIPQVSSEVARCLAEARWSSAIKLYQSYGLFIGGGVFFRSLTLESFSCLGRRLFGYGCGSLRVSPCLSSKGLGLCCLRSLS